VHLLLVLLSESDDLLPQRLSLLRHFGHGLLAQLLQLLRGDHPLLDLALKTFDLL
jgi:hypothetical protein